MPHYCSLVSYFPQSILMTLQRTNSEVKGMEECTCILTEEFALPLQKAGNKLRGMSNGNYNGTIKGWTSLSLSKSLEHFRIILIITKRGKRGRKREKRRGGEKKKKTEKDIKTDTYMYTSMQRDKNSNIQLGQLQMHTQWTMESTMDV